MQVKISWTEGSSSMMRVRYGCGEVTSYSFPFLLEKGRATRFPVSAKLMNEARAGTPGHPLKISVNAPPGFRLKCRRRDGKIQPRRASGFVRVARCAARFKPGLPAGSESVSGYASGRRG